MESEELRWNKDKILQIPSMIEFLPVFGNLPTDDLLPVFPQRVILRFLSDTLRDGINEDYQGFPAFPSNVFMTRPTESFGALVTACVYDYDCPKFLVRMCTSIRQAFP